MSLRQINVLVGCHVQKKEKAHEELEVLEPPELPAVYDIPQDEEKKVIADKNLRFTMVP